DDGWHVRLETPRGAIERAVPFSVALGWTFVLPFEHPLEPKDAWWSALWLASLAFPAVLWGALAGLADDARGASRRAALRGGALPFAILLGALALVPRMANFHAATALEWGGLMTGGALALLAAPVARRLALGATARRERR
ncbi:MAG TPA: hypothetical protein VFV33_12645, partial [Gemmatimonadaceae bacterium]|nr:hypothetical protein [Gemmatimonadaceae bacterium]